MKVLYYNCFSGISGDMNLAALIDLGVDLKYLNKELNKLKINDEFELKITHSKKNGITGTKVDVILKQSKNKDDHYHRHYDDIKKIILNSNLSEFVKKRSIETFDKIAIAEAKIHGVKVDNVHFHEVGATDSIIDIVGNAICMEFLKPDLVISSPIQLGGGFVECKHGTFPVPAPATTEILKNVPVKTGLVNSETTTPTGAAVIMSNATKFVEQLDFNIHKIGYGLGAKDFNIPNVLRIVLGEVSDERTKTSCYVCECNIDDMNPEMYTHIFEKLFSFGADDVYLTPIMMKKNRPANKLSIICKEELLNKITDFILRETTSFGLRFHKSFKHELDRKIQSIVIEDIEIKIKYAYIDGEKIKYKPEYNDCAKFAEIKNISLSEVYKLVEQQINKL